MGRIAAAQNGSGGFGGAKGLEDAVLEGTELVFRSSLLADVAANRDVNDTTGGDVGRQQNGREFDLYVLKLQRSDMELEKEYQNRGKRAQQRRTKQSRSKQNRPACETYQALVWGQQHCDASVNLADRQGDEHG